MGMGSYNNHSKGNGSGGSGSGGSRGNGKSYGLMLVLAFGAALLGVLLLHKLRERRIFNLLLKEKDSDLLSLHHLLQTERDYTKELRRKNEEIKAKLYPIRTQKMELDRRISELKSTIGSLKEELQTLDAVLEEKQSEIKVLRLRLNADNGNPQAMELVETLKRKEAEIEDLKHQVEDLVKVRSVSTDDPSNSLVNLIMYDSVSGKEKTEIAEKKEEGDRLQESTGNKDIAETISGAHGNGNKSIGREDQIGNGETETDRRETNGGTEEVEKITNTTGKDGGFVTGAKETNIASEAETMTNTTGKDVDHEVNDGEENKITRNGHVGNIENSEPGEKQKLYASPKGGDRQKKWRLVTRNRRLENRGNLENDGVGSVRSRKFFKDDQAGLMGREDEAGSNRKLAGDHLINSSDVKGLELQNSENTEELKNKLARVNTSEANGKFDSVTHNDRKQKVEVGESEEHEARNIQQQNLNSKDTKKLEDSDEEMNTADPQDADLEVVDAEEQETDVTDDNIFDESGSGLEEDKEEYREEIDESEF
ncbi:unnamed protein product [Malus baccata var. baccata]